MRAYNIIILLLLIGCLTAVYLGRAGTIEGLTGKQNPACRRRSKVTRADILGANQVSTPMSEYEALYQSNTCVPRRVRQGRSVAKVCQCTGHGTKPSQWFPGGACSAQDKSL